MIKLSTIKQDDKVLKLRRKGLVWKEVALRLNITIDRAKHAERRLPERVRQERERYDIRI